jgi:hypothetical protein
MMMRRIAATALLLASAGFFAGSALAQFPSPGSILRGAAKPKPPESPREGKREQPNSNQGTSFAAPTAPQGATQGITSELHRQNIGKIVFSGQDMPLDRMNAGMLKDAFTLGDEIYYRVYMAEPAPTRLYGKVPGVDDHNTAYFTQYRMRFTVDGRPYEVSQRPWGTADEYKTWTTWRGQLLSRGDRFFPGQESFGELLSRATRKGDLGPGSYRIGVELIPVVIINEGTGGRNNFVEKARGAAVGKGEFTLTVTPSSYDRSDRKICGDQAVQSNPALENTILGHVRSVWNRPEAPPAKVRITHSGWTIVRHPITGIIMSRKIDAAIMSRGADYCDIQGYSYSQPYVGGNFSTSGARFDGAQTYGTYIPCSCIG